MMQYATEDELPGAPLAPLPSDTIKTQGWRTFRPIIHLEKCTRCNVCWKFCPDVAIHLDAQGWPVVDMDHCKGCGICVEECTPKAMEMVKEEA